MTQLIQLIGYLVSYDIIWSTRNKGSQSEIRFVRNQQNKIEQKDKQNSLNLNKILNTLNKSVLADEKWWIIFSQAELNRVSKLSKFTVKDLQKLQANLSTLYFKLLNQESSNIYFRASYKSNKNIERIEQIFDSFKQNSIFPLKVHITTSLLDNHKIVS